MVNKIDYTNYIDKLPSVYYFCDYTPSFKRREDNTEDFINYFIPLTKPVANEMSDMNLSVLLNYLVQLGDTCKFIVEIGVMRDRNKQNTTLQFLKNKVKDCIYLGIDIEDRSYILSLADNVHFLRTDSGDLNKIVNYINTHINRPIDFLYIDGLHSVSQVGKEIALINYVRPGGVIGFHDIAYHPGPNAWIDAFSEKYFHINKYYADSDYGVGVIVKK